MNYYSMILSARFVNISAHHLSIAQKKKWPATEYRCGPNSSSSGMPDLGGLPKIPGTA
jgi:hypothetical protein